MTKAIVCARASVLVVLGWLLGVPLVVFGQESRQFGHVIYSIPDGWHTGRVDDYATVLSDDDEVGFFATIRVHGGLETEGRHPDAVLAERRRAVLGEDEEFEQIGAPVRTQADGRTVLLVGEKAGNRLRLHALTVVEGWAYHAYLTARVDRETAAGISGAFSEFTGELRFTTDGAAPLLGPPSSGELSGVYHGTVTGYGMSGVELGSQVYMFSESGRFYDGVPKGASLETLDPREALSRFPHECGNYAVGGDTIELSYADGSVETMDFAREVDGLELDGTFYARVEPLSDGVRLDGQYSSVFYSGFSPGSGIKGGVGGARSLTLFDDGRWESSSFVGAFGNFENTAGDLQGGFATSSGDRDGRDDRGTYEIESGVLVLTAESGSVLRKSILRITDGMLLIDGSTMLDRSKTGE